MYRVICVLALLSGASFAKGVDPTKPFTFGQQSNNSSKQQPVEQKKLILEAIIHARGIHTAVINNQELQVGDHIGEYRLVAVNNASVVLRSKEERLVLRAFSGVVVK